MSTDQVQLKLSLSSQLSDLLRTKADRVGIPLTQFVKYLLVREVEDNKYPTFTASAKTEKRARMAMKNINKAKTIANINDYFDSL